MEQTGRKKQDELSIAEVIRGLAVWVNFLFSRWLVIVLAGIIAGGLGLLYAFTKKPMYEAPFTFVLQEENESQLGAAAGIASLIGLNLGGPAGANALFKGDNIFELYRSRRMLVKTLLTPSGTPGAGTLMVNRYMDVMGYREAWKKDPKLAGITFKPGEQALSIQQDSVLTVFVEQINKDLLDVDKPDKKLSIIRIAFSSPDQAFSRDFVNVLVADVNDFYIQTRTKKERQNVNKLQHQADSVRALLYGSIHRTAAAEEANPNVNEALRHLGVESQMRQVDVRANATIYEQIVTNLEVSKMTLSRETPLIQEVDVPVLPLKKAGARKLTWLVGAGFLGAFLAMFWLVARRIWVQEIRPAA